MVSIFLYAVYGSDSHDIRHTQLNNDVLYTTGMDNPVEQHEYRHKEAQVDRKKTSATSNASEPIMYGYYYIYLHIYIIVSLNQKGPVKVFS